MAEFDATKGLGKKAKQLRAQRRRDQASLNGSDKQSDNATSVPVCAQCIEDPPCHGSNSLSTCTVKTGLSTVTGTCAVCRKRGAERKAKCVAKKKSQANSFSLEEEEQRTQLGGAAGLSEFQRRQQQPPQQPPQQQGPAKKARIVPPPMTFASLDAPAWGYLYSKMSEWRAARPKTRWKPDNMSSDNRRHEWRARYRIMGVEVLKLVPRRGVKETGAQLAERAYMFLYEHEEDTKVYYDENTGNIDFAKLCGYAQKL